MKRVKKSTSVQNTPEKANILEEQTTNTPRSTRGARKHDLATPKSANTAGSGPTLNYKDDSSIKQGLI